MKYKQLIYRKKLKTISKILKKELKLEEELKKDKTQRDISNKFRRAKRN